MISDIEYTETDRQFMDSMLREIKSERKSEALLWALLITGTFFWAWLLWPWLQGFFELAQYWWPEFMAHGWMAFVGAFAMGAMIFLGAWARRQK